MSALNLVKVAAASFVVGAAIGGGIAAYVKLRDAKNKATAEAVMDPMEKALREAAEKMGFKNVKVTVTRTTRS